MTVTEPCTSPTIAALSPDLRVNYTFGMVLGLDEFVQEQFHQQEKDALHRRLLHGYGTSYGLTVSAAATNDTPQDYIVTVSPGAGVDQWGREFVIREPQTARIGPWLADQVRGNPDLIAFLNDSSGGFSVYLVASYATCLDNVVSLPGQPCGQPAQAPSRIRDSWQLEFRLARPATPRWDLDRRMADLLNSVVLVPPDGIDIGHSDLVQAVRDLRTSPTRPIPIIRVSQMNYREVFDEALTVWATEIRPQLTPDLLAPDPASDPAVPIATLHVNIVAPFDPDNPIISFARVEDGSRPVLLSSQLVQEVTAPPRLVVDPIELATLTPDPPNARPYTIGVRLHAFDGNLVAPSTITVHVTGPSTTSTEGPVTFTVISEPAYSGSFWRLYAPNNFTPAGGQRLKVSFDNVQSFSGMALADWTASQGITLLDGGDAYALVPWPTTSGALALKAGTDAAAAEPAAPDATVPAEFVTITDVPADTGQLGFELWFHPGSHGAQDTTTVSQPQVRIVDELTGDPVEVSGLTRDPFHGNVWTLSTEQPHNDRPFPAYFRFVFPADGFELVGPASGSTGLADWIGGGAAFVGWDAGQASVVAHHRVATPAVTAARATTAVDDPGSAAPAEQTEPARHATRRAAAKAGKPAADKNPGSTPR